MFLYFCSHIISRHMILLTSSTPESKCKLGVAGKSVFVPSQANNHNPNDQKRNRNTKTYHSDKYIKTNKQTKDIQRYNKIHTKYFQGTCLHMTFGCNPSTQTSMWQRLAIILRHSGLLEADEDKIRKIRPKGTLVTILGQYVIYTPLTVYRISGISLKGDPSSHSETPVVPLPW